MANNKLEKKTFKWLFYGYQFGEGNCFGYGTGMNVTKVKNQHNSHRLIVLCIVPLTMTIDRIFVD